jgi:ferredoxin-type protein NapF
MQEHGLPTVDFSRGFCTFCGECARSCPAEALCFDAAAPPWDLRASVDESCLLAQRVLCQSCGERCGKGAIVFMPGALRQPTILPDKCDGCGACGSVCPAGAIFFTSASDSAQ